MAWVDQNGNVTLTKTEKEELAKSVEARRLAGDWVVFDEFPSQELLIATEAALKGYDIAKYCPDGVLRFGPGSWCFREDEQ